MKVVLQVVNRASVYINNTLYNNIEKGYLLLVGISRDDDEEKVKLMANKIAKLRIFKDENDKINLNIFAVSGKILSISQFTLYANTNSNRPDFLLAASKDKALDLYKKFNLELEKLGIEVKEGKFGEDMKIDLENDGPCTILLEN